MKTSAFYCLYSNLGQFNDEQKFLARMEIVKIMRHVKLQQNLDTYSACFLPSFSNAIPFQTRRLFAPNPQPVTSMHNSEILSRYLSNYSVEPQRPQNFSINIIPVPALSPVTHLSCQVKMGVVTYFLSCLSVQQRICKLNFFFHFCIQIL